MLNLSFEALAREAQPYSDRLEFLNAKPHLYRQARKQGWLDRLFAQAPEQGEPAPKPERITFEVAQQVARRYRYQSHFSRYAKSVYRVAAEKEWLDDICAHMEPARGQSWTLREIQTEANKYASISEFRKASHGAYNKLQRCYAHHKARVYAQAGYSVPKRFTIEEITELVKASPSRAAFRRTHPRAYRCLIGQSTEIKERVLSHLPVVRKAPTPLEDLIALAKPYPTIQAFRKDHESHYQRIMRRDWIQTIFGDRPYKMKKAS